MPSLEKLHQHFLKDNFSLLTVDVKEEAEVVRRFAKKNRLSFPILLDTDGEVSSTYGVQSHPMTFLIDKKGTVLGFAIGYREWDRKEMKTLIRSLLQKKG